MVLVGDDEAGRTQAIAVQGGADLAPIGEGHGRGAVPRLHQGRMVFVESLALGIHQRIAGPGFRDQHHHRMGQRIAAGQQQLQRIVQAGGVRLAVRDQRPHFVEVRAQQVGLHPPATGVHPVHIAADGVDLTVVGHEAVGVGQPPGGEGVGGEALVDHGQGGLRQGIGQVLVEGPHLSGQQQPLVNHGAGRQGRQIEILQARQALLLRQLGDGVLDLLAHGQQLPLMSVLILDGRAAADEGLADHRHGVEHSLADAVQVHRHVAPAQDRLLLDLHEVFELGHGDLARGLIAGQEAHGHGVFAGRRQIDAVVLGPGAIERVGNLNQNPGPVADQRVGAHRAAVVQIDQNLQTRLHDFMRFAAFDIGYKPNAARIMLVTRIIQSLPLWRPHMDSLPLATGVRPRGPEGPFRTHV